MIERRCVGEHAGFTHRGVGAVLLVVGIERRGVVRHQIDAGRLASPDVFEHGVQFADGGAFPGYAADAIRIPGTDMRRQTLFDRLTVGDEIVRVAVEPERDNHRQEDVVLFRKQPGDAFAYRCVGQLRPAKRLERGYSLIIGMFPAIREICLDCVAKRLRGDGSLGFHTEDKRRVVPQQVGILAAVGVFLRLLAYIREQRRFADKLLVPRLPQGVHRYEFPVPIDDDGDVDEFANPAGWSKFVAGTMVIGYK